MAKITVREITDEKEWEAFHLKHESADFLHSYAYGETHRNIGKKVFYRGFYCGDRLIGISLGILEKAKRGWHIIVPGGPFFEWSDTALVSTWVNDVRALAVSNNCVFVRVRPQLLESPENVSLFKNLGFVKAPMHLTAEDTLQLDTTQSLEDVLAGMRKNTRYDIKKAERLGIAVHKSNSLSDIDRFCAMQRKTAKRQEFVAFSDEVIKSEFASFCKRNQATLYTATLNGELLAQALIIHYPTESAYHFGASTKFGHKYPGAAAIQWQVIKDSKVLGIPRYNLWGIVGESEKNHRFYGVSVFKRGFGGREVRYLHAMDLVIKPIQYRINKLIEEIRKRGRRL